MTPYICIFGCNTTQSDPPLVGFCVFKRYNRRMIRQQIIELSATPVDVTYSGPFDRLNVLSIQNIMSTGYAYLGNQNVSDVEYGHKLYPGQSFTIELSPNDKLFAVGDAGVSIAKFVLDIG